MTDDTAAPAAQSVDTGARVEPDDDEGEVQAIATISRALKQLSPDTRRRVIDWAAAKYGTSNTSERSIGERESAVAAGPAARLADNGSTGVDPESYEDFGALFDAVQADTDLERTLTACYWVQVRLKKNPFLSQDANTLLKNLGHQVKDITVPFDAMRRQRPSLVIQLKKEGSHQQSRKQYRLTPSGIRLVTEALRTGGFTKPDAP
jgi:hypothetical protein